VFFRGLCAPPKRPERLPPSFFNFPSIFAPPHLQLGSTAKILFFACRSFKLTSILINEVSDPFSSLPCVTTFFKLHNAGLSPGFPFLNFFLYYLSWPCFRPLDILFSLDTILLGQPSSVLTSSDGLFYLPFAPSYQFSHFDLFFPYLNIAGHLSLVFNGLRSTIFYPLLDLVGLKCPPSFESCFPNKALFWSVPPTRSLSVFLRPEHLSDPFGCDPPPSPHSFPQEFTATCFSVDGFFTLSVRRQCPIRGCYHVTYSLEDIAPTSANPRFYYPLTRILVSAESPSFPCPLRERRGLNPYLLCLFSSVGVSLGLPSPKPISMSFRGPLGLPLYTSLKYSTLPFLTRFLPPYYPTPCLLTMGLFIFPCSFQSFIALTLFFSWKIPPPGFLRLPQLYQSCFLKTAEWIYPLPSPCVLKGSIYFYKK